MRVQRGNFDFESSTNNVNCRVEMQVSFYTHVLVFYEYHDTNINRKTTENRIEHYSIIVEVDFKLN